MALYDYSLNVKVHASLWRGLFHPNEWMDGTCSPFRLGDVSSGNMLLMDHQVKWAWLGNLDYRQHSRLFTHLGRAPWHGYLSTNAPHL